jgi:predicted DNA binding CopG/RHH family protein
MPKKIFSKLTAEERAIEKEFDRFGKPVANLAIEKKRLKEIAYNTLAKNKTITIRVTPRTFNRLKVAAAREGIPYQTLVSSIIHKNT